MYSIDYPFVSFPSLFFAFMWPTQHHVVDTHRPRFFVIKELISDGATWINSLSSVLTKENLDSLRREVAIKVLRLNE
jgi:hypothetical protein